MHKSFCFLPFQEKQKKTFAFIDCSEYFIPKFCEEKFRSLEGFIYYEKKIFFRTVLRMFFLGGTSHLIFIGVAQFLLHKYLDLTRIA